MKIQAYVVNLDRSPDRLAAIEKDAAAAGLTLIRVPAVDGKTVPPAERALLDEAGFLRIHGKRPMAGEYGCYVSHLNALRAFLESDAPYALIFEDDIKIPSDLATIVAEIVAKEDWDLVKLVHHRMRSLKVDRVLANGRRLGRARFGPTGSAAAYLVNRHGAERLLACLVPMRLPYDIALERGWACGIRTRHVRPDAVSLHPDFRTSLTRDGGQYAQMKLPPWRRFGALWFRTLEFVRRLTSSSARS